MSENWKDKLVDAAGELEFEVDVTPLIALAAEAARSASWWQAQCEGKEAVIAELRDQVAYLRGRLEHADDFRPVAQVEARSGGPIA